MSLSRIVSTLTLGFLGEAKPDPDYIAVPLNVLAKATGAQTEAADDISDKLRSLARSIEKAYDINAHADLNGQDPVSNLIKSMQNISNEVLATKQTTNSEGKSALIHSNDLFMLKYASVTIHEATDLLNVKIKQATRNTVDRAIQDPRNEGKIVRLHQPPTHTDLYSTEADADFDDFSHLLIDQFVNSVDDIEDLRTRQSDLNYFKRAIKIHLAQYVPDEFIDYDLQEGIDEDLANHSAKQDALRRVEWD